MITDVTQYKKKKLTEKGGNHLARTDGWTKKTKQKQQMRAGPTKPQKRPLQ